jgi:hypothetical protein
MSEVLAWPKVTGTMVEPPRRLVRPCDAGLLLAVQNLETQLGTIEAYNRLVMAAKSLAHKIERGDAKAQNPLYAKSVRGE